jgi:hypothetical protein
MKRTYVLVDGEFVERKRDERGRYHYVLPDIQPYKSMIDGQMVTSRSQHRRLLKAAGCVEIGNEDPSKHYRKPQVQDTRREVLKAQLANMTHREANGLIARLRDDLRFTRNNPHRD